ncbi:MAG: hypothetical protein ACT4OX_01640 [Actinomycetota bacterium]
MGCIARVLAGAGAALLVATPAAPAAEPKTGASTPAEVIGRLQVAIADDFAHGRAVEELRLETRNGLLHVDARGPMRARAHELAGRRVRIRGQRRGGGLTAAALDAVDTPRPAANLAAGPQVRRVAVVMLRDRDRPEPIARSVMENVMFGAGGVARFYSEASYGQLQMTGRVFGYYEATFDPLDCSWRAWVADAERLAARDGYSPDDFEHLVVYVPARDYLRPGCGFGGMAGPGQYSAIHGLTDPTVLVRGIVHELGHNLGLDHAAALDCGDQTIAPPSDCAVVPYGDRFDPMSYRPMDLTFKHFHAFHKHQLGFLPASQQRTLATAGRHIVQLESSSLPPIADAVQSVRIPTPSGTYLVERREPTGSFEIGTCCVWLRVIRIREILLLDATPSTDTKVGRDGFADAHLAVGKTFTDPAAGVSITTVADAHGVATLKICLGPCSPPIAVEFVGRMLRVRGTPDDDLVRVWMIAPGVFAIGTDDAPVALGAGCAREHGFPICRSSRRYPLVKVELGAGNDRVELAGTFRSWLSGGIGDDAFVGGDGPDWFFGGPGIDTVDYRGRAGSAPLRGTPGTGTDDGRPGEKDNVRGDVEQVLLPG